MTTAVDTAADAAIAASIQRCSKALAIAGLTTRVHAACVTHMAPRAANSVSVSVCTGNSRPDNTYVAAKGDMPVAAPSAENAEYNICGESVEPGSHISGVLLHNPTMSGYFRKPSKNCARAARKPGPVYPLIKTPVINGISYFVQFSLQLTTSPLVPAAFQNAYLLTSIAAADQPVIITTDSLSPVCPAQITTAAVIDVMTNLGNAIPNPAPVVLQVVNAQGTGPASTFVAGTSVDGDTLTYKPASVLATLTDSSPYEFFLHSNIVPITTNLSTGNACTVASNMATPLVLCAVPVAGTGNQFYLKWLPSTGTQGYVVAAITLCSTSSCGPCSATNPGTSNSNRHNTCQCAILGASSGITPL